MRPVLILAGLVACLAACTAEVEIQQDPDDAAALVPGALAAPAPGQLRVVQMNPYYAGRLAPYTESANACSATAECTVSGRSACTSTSQTGCWECIDHRCRHRTYEAFTHAAGLFAAIHADVIGIEELDPAYAPKLATILEANTGEPWDYEVSPQGIGGKGSGIGAYWRRSRVELVADLGSVDVDTLPSHYVVRFRGVILEPRGTTRQLGFVSGKLVWGSAGDDTRRHAEAVRLRTWIDAQMAAHPSAKARIVASDFNDTIGSDAYDVFADYDDGGAVKPTSHAVDPRERIDYLLWADSSAGASRDGFVTARSDGRLGRSEYYGSDHRFVYGDASIP